MTIRVTLQQVVTAFVGLLLAVVAGLLVNFIWQAASDEAGETTAEIETIAEIRRVSFSSAVFPSEQSYEVIRVYEYEAVTSGLVKNVKFSAIFGEGSEILRYNVLYLLDISGFRHEFPSPNHVILKLTHHLDATRSARIYLIAKNIVRSKDNIGNLAHPKMTLEGIDKNENGVYAYD